jgi:mono/diheme cytochrome c family protein
LWSAALWNHAPEMEEAMKAEGIAWPKLSPDEVNDILAYLRTIGNVPRERAPLPGDPRHGRSLFRRDCQKCHRAEGQGGEIGPDLDVGAEARTLSGLAASFWNHSPAMGESMNELRWSGRRSRRQIWRISSPTSCDPLLRATGDLAVGNRIYEDRCGTCHGKEGQEKGKDVPDLGSYGSQVSAVFLASALWNHGPRMYEQAKEQGLAWPRFENHEMHDLIAYLRSLGIDRRSGRIRSFR